ncbi:MAG: nitroreductase family protein [Aerococcus sp.]|nr:nitroreductase family protein [Aerococcus sp.]
MAVNPETVNYKNNNFADVFLNRHSVRAFDSEQVISRDEITAMLEEAATTPSACNLQSWKYVVCDTAERREKLRDAILPFNFRHFDSAPVTVFILGDTEAHKVYRQLWTAVYERGDITKEHLDEIFNQFLPLYENADRAFLERDATVDSAMLAMSLLLTIRAHGYEAVAWAGYKPDEMVRLLGQDSERYISVMAISFGVPSDAAYGENDFNSERYDIDTFTEFLD